MRFAIFDRNAWSFDPRPYLVWLRSNASELPPGARRFAMDPNHFDYCAYRTPDLELVPGSPLCTKDLLLRSVDVRPHERLSVELCFLFPGFELEAVGTYDLVLRYPDVTRFNVNEEPNHPRRVPSGLGHLMIDEVVPAGAGILHELAFENGTIAIEARDLHAHWR